MRPEKLLKHHKLRKTAGRIAVLEVLATYGKAVSHSELQSQLGSLIDRVTLYRILESFEQKGILHKVPDDQVSVKYALCGHDHDIGHQHADDHAHFKCGHCGDTYCLEGSKIPSIPAPEGFQVSERFVLLQGTCNQCQ